MRRKPSGVTAAEEAAFDAWLSNSEANRAAYARACEAWEAVDQVALGPTVQALRISVLGRRPKRHPSPTQFAAIAAALVLSLGLGVVAVDGSGVAAWLSGETRYATDVGERLDVVLADGTVLTLNTDSRLAVRYRGDRREVRMDPGQAYFDVAHDPSRPFSVEGGGRRVTALGTRFTSRTPKRRSTLKQGADCVPAAEISRRARIGPPTNWKKKNDGVLPTEMKRLN